ncbi:MAG: alpha/beta fold hydrolase [Cyclobacteriaceae bacterium]
MHRLRNTWYFYMCVLALITATACQSDDEEAPDNGNTALISYERMAAFTGDQLKVIAAFTGYSEYQDLIEYGLTLYKITYRTEFQGERVEASGVLSVPQGSEQFPVLLGGHGTITNDQKAPSNLNFNQNNSSGFELFAAFGFISVIPDYLGFGASADLLHPYFNYTTSAQSSVDMIRATQEFLADSIAYRPELFLTGYSQGGYVAMATLKFLEETPGVLPEFTIKATAAGAGGYDIRQGIEDILSETTYPSPVNLAFLIYSYQQTNGWNHPLTDYFKEPYASQIPALFDGNTDASTINAQLPQNLSALLNPDFIAQVFDDSETEFLNALEANSVDDWAPQTPVRLYHEQDDEVIPIQNSESTYKKMLQNGAEDVYYFPYDEAEDHRSGAQPMYEQALPWFVSLRKSG